MFAPPGRGAVYPNGLDEVNTSYFWGTLAKFKAAIEEDYGNKEHRDYYRAIIAVWEGMIERAKEKGG